MTGENKDDTLIIILKENNGKVEPKYIGDTDFVLETTTAAEVNYIAFDVASIDYHQQLYGAVHRKFKKQYINEKYKDTKPPENVEEEKDDDNIRISSTAYCNKRILRFMCNNQARFGVSISDGDLKITNPDEKGENKYCKLDPRYKLDFDKAKQEQSEAKRRKIRY